ncbi:MAG: hypothetical protein SX243_22790 [Acidobacteriota bacterium]|nr:hypothetical protein [Acidobacteriota bacterium]
MADSTTTTSSKRTGDRDEQVDRIVLENARAAATAIAYQEIAQSMVLAVQSSVQHLQGLFTVNIATTGAVFSQALEGTEEPKELERRLDASQKTVQAGIEDLRTLTQAAAEALRSFPSSTPPPPGDAATASTGSSPRKASPSRKTNKSSTKSTTAQKKTKS